MGVRYHHRTDTRMDATHIFGGVYRRRRLCYYHEWEKEMKLHLITDIETLEKKTTGVIMSVAMVAFDPQ